MARAQFCYLTFGCRLDLVERATRSVMGANGKPGVINHTG